MIDFRGGRLLKSGYRNGLGSGFRGLIDYLQKGRATQLQNVLENTPEQHQLPPAEAAEPEPNRVAWSTTRNLPTDDIDRAPNWMRAWANQNPRVENPVYHFGVSVAPDEKLGPKQWNLVVDRLMERLGVEEHQAVIALHQDREHQHIHIVLNRVGPDGRVWKPRFEIRQQQQVLRQLEQELGLRAVPTYGDRRREMARELGVPARELEKPFALKVRDVALEDFRQSYSFEELEERLAQHGLRLEVASRGGGVNVTDGIERAGLSRVDRSLSGPRLRDRFGETFRVYRARVPDPVALERRFREEAMERQPDELAEEILDHVFATRSTITREHLEQAARGYPDSDFLVALALRGENVVPLGTDAKGHQRFTRLDYAEVEERMFEAAGELAAGTRHRLEGEGVESLLAGAKNELSAEQLGAVRHALRRNLSLVVGRAGSGKTRLTRTLVQAYQDAGYRVRGAALAGQARPPRSWEPRPRSLPAPSPRSSTPGSPDARSSLPTTSC